MSKEAALPECLKALGDKDYTLSDYREKEIILISLFKSQNIPAKVGFLSKMIQKSVASDTNKISLLRAPPLCQGGVGAGHVCERATRLLQHYIPLLTSLWRMESYN